MQAARLLLPALRWDERTGFDHERPRMDIAIARGVGGFVLFGGEAGAVYELTESLRTRCAHPLLIAADLERGAGQQFRGATGLPPLAALGALDDLATTRQAAALTAREALALGVNWVLGPDSDLDLEPDNPIIGTRSFGADPVRVAAHVTAWIEGCQSEGALCCAKHFPGHGRTTTDSHAVLPAVTASRKELERDLTPFRAAVLAGTDAVMTAHVAFPAIDPSNAPATLSQPIVDGLLRNEIGFDGLVATDAFNMRGVLDGDRTEGEAGVAAIAAGCDLLLYPPDIATMADALEAALGAALPRARVARSIGRLNSAAARVGAEHGDGMVGRATDLAWANSLAARCVKLLHGRVPVERSFDMVTLDDDLGGPFPAPSRDVFPRALRDAGLDPRESDQGASASRPVLVAVYADIRAWKGRPGLSVDAKARIASIVKSRPDCTVLLFGHPRLAAEFAAPNVVVAWGGEAVMQRAAARFLADESAPPPAA
ncbi:MAG: glycoside hydrolase family 3 protein [Longimicrobiales bacterium]